MSHVNAKTRNAHAKAVADGIIPPSQPLMKALDDITKLRPSPAMTIRELNEGEKDIMNQLQSSIDNQYTSVHINDVLGEIKRLSADINAKNIRLEQLMLELSRIVSGVKIGDWYIKQAIENLEQGVEMVREGEAREEAKIAEQLALEKKENKIK